MLKRISYIFSSLLLLILSVTLSGNETAQLYFPSSIGSYWVYEDQHGNELTRQVVEGEEISGATYYGFSYDPELEDWIDFDRHFAPYLFHVGDEWVSSLVGEEAENAVKARLSKEMDTLEKLAQNVFAEQAPPELNITLNLIYDVEAKSEDNFFLLPLDMTPNEEWDSINMTATVSFTMDVQGLPEFQAAADFPTITLDIDIQETGIILGTETVDVTAGTFEDCLKIQFQTETEFTASEPNPTQEQPGESVTTIWLAPNVGIVKYYQESENIILNTMSESDFSEAALTQPEIDVLIAPIVKSYELERYEIVPIEDKGKEE